MSELLAEMARLRAELEKERKRVRHLTESRDRWRAEARDWRWREGCTDLRPKRGVVSTSNAQREVDAA